MSRALLPPPRKKKEFDSALAIVNIVLLLLFFFLATGSVLNSEPTVVTIPETSELPIDLLPEPILVVTETGGFELNGEPVPEGGLAEAVIDFPTLHIFIDKNASASELLDLLGSEDLIAVELKLVTIHIKTGEGG